MIIWILWSLKSWCSWIQAFPLLLFLPLFIAFVSFFKFIKCFFHFLNPAAQIFIWDGGIYYSCRFCSMDEDSLLLLKSGSWKEKNTCLCSLIIIIFNIMMGWCFKKWKWTWNYLKFIKLFLLYNEQILDYKNWLVFFFPFSYMGFVRKGWNWELDKSVTKVGKSDYSMGYFIITCLLF